jgi:hypothetical protein
MTINWSALGLVFLVSLAATLLVIVLFAVGVRTWNRGRGGLAVAIGSFTLCGAVTLFGIALILA